MKYIKKKSTLYNAGIKQNWLKIGVAYPFIKYSSTINYNDEKAHTLQYFEDLC